MAEKPTQDEQDAPGAERQKRIAAEGAVGGSKNEGLGGGQGTPGTETGGFQAAHDLARQLSQDPPR